MKMFTLLALLGGAVGFVAVTEDAEGCRRRRQASCSQEVYMYPPPVYMHPPEHVKPPKAMQPTKVVEVSAIDKVGFKPKSITVAPGTTVRWVNQGKERHTVTSRDGLFDSGPMAPGSTYSYEFTKPGTYEYFCRPHEKAGMTGTVIVDPKARPAPGSGESGY